MHLWVAIDPDGFYVTIPHFEEKMKRFCFKLPSMTAACCLAAISFASFLGSTAQAERVRLTIENVNGDTYFTPVFAGFHDGSFDLRQPTASTTFGEASDGLELLAELGMTGGLTSEFNSGSALRQAGTLGAGPFGPGQSVSQEFDLDLTGPNTRLTLASMLLPSSDTFIGNISTPAFDISSILGGGTLTFDLTALYDAGTEVNDFATSPGNGLLRGNPALGLDATIFPDGNPTAGVEENGTISLVNPTSSVFANFLGQPTNGPLTAAPSSFRVTVTAVPEPATGLAGCLALTGLMIRRRRQKIS